MQKVKSPKSDSDDSDDSDDDSGDESGQGDDDDDGSDIGDIEVQDESDAAENVTIVAKPWWKQKYPLPHWCMYAAWVLALASILGSAAFIFIYGLEWGKEKSEEWLSSLMFSFAESIMFVQPFKVLPISPRN